MAKRDFDRIEETQKGPEVAILGNGSIAEVMDIKDGEINDRGIRMKMVRLRPTADFGDMNAVNPKEEIGGSLIMEVPEDELHIVNHSPNFKRYLIASDFHGGKNTAMNLIEGKYKKLYDLAEMDNGALQTEIDKLLLRIKELSEGAYDAELMKDVIREVLKDLLPQMIAQIKAES